MSNRLGRFSILFSCLARYKMTLFSALVFSAIYGLTDGLIPILLKFSLESLSSPDLDGLTFSFEALPWLILGVAFLRASTGFAHRVCMTRVVQGVIRDLRLRINSYLMSYSPAFFQKYHSADIVSRLNADLGELRPVLTQSSSAAVRNVFRVCSLLAVALWLDYELALIGFLIFPLAFVPIFFLGRYSRRMSRTAQAALAQLSIRLSEQIRAFRDIRAFHAEERELERFAEHNLRTYSSYVRLDLIRAAAGPVNELIAAFAAVVVLGYAAQSISSGERSTAEFLAFLSALFLMYGPMKSLSKTYSRAQQSLGALDRVLELIPQGELAKSQHFIAPLADRWDLEFEKITFGFTPEERLVLQDLDLTIPYGSSFGLVGKTGSGKSTLVDLALSFLKPQKGAVRIASYVLQQIPTEVLRQNLAVVNQHPYLFQASVLDNLRLADPQLTEQKAEVMLSSLGLWSIVEELPQGLDTILPENAQRLSGGQRACIALSRALLRDAQIYIFDEAFASLDAATERNLMEHIREMLSDRTLIFITHRLQSLSQCDRIAVLDKGKIAAQGTYERLNESSVLFRQLSNFSIRAEKALSSDDEATATAKDAVG